MSKFLIIKIRTGCQNIRYFYCSEKLYWAARKLRLGRGLDVAAVDIAVRLDWIYTKFCVCRLCKNFSRNYSGEFKYKFCTCKPDLSVHSFASGI